MISHDQFILTPHTNTFEVPEWVESTADPLLFFFIDHLQVSFQQSNSCLLAPPARPQQNAGHHWQEAPKHLGVWGNAWTYIINYVAICLNKINLWPKIQPQHLACECHPQMFCPLSDGFLVWTLESIHGPEVLHDTSGIARLEELHFCQAMTTGREQSLVNRLFLDRWSWHPLKTL